MIANLPKLAFQFNRIVLYFDNSSGILLYYFDINPKDTSKVD